MRQKTAPLIIASTFTLAGCGNGGIFQPKAEPPSLVPVSQIVNAIKCELAETFQGGRYAQVIREDKEGQDIKGTLNLSNVVAFARNAEAGGEIVPLGVTFDPSLAYTKTTTTGQSYELKFAYDLEAGSKVPSWCSTLDVKVEGHPFMTMLNGIMLEHSKIQKGDPKVQFGTIAYGSKFELKREIVGGLKIKFLVFSLGAKVTKTTTEGQTLTLLFDLGLLPKLVPPP